MSKIYISPERRQKPHGKFWEYEVYESDLCYEMANRIACQLKDAGFEVKLPSQRLDMYQRVKDANEWDADYYLCLHTNASTNGTKEGKATGPMVIRFGKEGFLSDKACKEMYSFIMRNYWQNEGVGVVGNIGNFYEINNTKMLSVYVELGFHDNSDDAAWLLNSKKSNSYYIGEAIAVWFGKHIKDWKKADIYDFGFYDEEQAPSKTEEKEPVEPVNIEKLEKEDFFKTLGELFIKFKDVL